MIAAWNRAWLRLQTDYQLAILSSFAACGFLGIFPFALYRFATGNALAGLVDTAIVACIVLAVVHAWTGGNRSHASLLLAVINTVGCLVSASVLGTPGLFWMYPALLGNFLLLSRRQAVLVTVVALTLLTVQGKAYDSTAQLFIFLVSASVSGLVAYVFASRTETQRLELEALATLDSLTGVPNRRAMETELANAVEQQRGGNGHFGLAMLDLDHFKRINDEHGHETGDEVLIAFTGLVRRCIRGSDRCFRFGGEEFVLLMPGMDRHALHDIDATLRRRVASELSCHGVAVTVSIGAAVLRQGEDWPSWLARADAALYRAKHEGRNRTVVDDPARVPPLPS